MTPLPTLRDLVGDCWDGRTPTLAERIAHISATEGAVRVGAVTREQADATIAAHFREYAITATGVERERAAKIIADYVCDPDDNVYYHLERVAAKIREATS